MNTPNSNTRATVAPSFRWRVGLFALMGIGMGLWSLYDGLVKFPRQREVAFKYQEYQEGGPEKMKEWPQYAESVGWPPDEEPGAPKHPYNIWFNHGVALITLPMGVYFLCWYFSASQKWIAMEGQTLTTSWGQKVDFSAVRSLNMLRWKSKGIARVAYQDGAVAKKLILDDWKYTRAPIGEMVKALENHLNPDQIIGREPPESPESPESPPPEAPPPEAPDTPEAPEASPEVLEEHKDGS